MIKVGLTGGIGSGKTTVAKVFEEFGIPVYYADTEAKKFLKTDFVKKSLVKFFGESVIAGDGEVDKAVLASIIFNDKKSLLRVNSLIHPLVRQDFALWALEREDLPYVILEVAILFENGFDLLVDKTITVTAPLEQRIERAVKRDNSNKEDIEARMKNQWPQDKITDLADYVIDNADESLILPQILWIDSILR
jgi:dephospho-CoA kinase